MNMYSRLSRTIRVALLPVLMVCGLLVFGASSASAAYTHQFLYQTAVPDNGSAIAVAVDGSTGAFYVADGGNDVLDAYAASGALEWSSDGSDTPDGDFNGPYGVAVDDATGDVYVADGDEVDVYSAGGDFLSVLTGVSFGSAQAVAVDQTTGDVYVADGQQVDVFDSSGAFVEAFSTSQFGNPAFIAVDDPSGELLVGNSAGVGVFDLATGAYETTWTGGGTPSGSFTNLQGVAVDPSDGDVYVVDWPGGGTGVVDELRDTGAYVGQTTGVDGTPFLPSGGIAVGESTGDLYVGIQSGSTNYVDVFGPGATVPDVTTGSASGVTTDAATLAGTVNPDGTTVTGCEFEYASDAQYQAALNDGALDPYASGGSVACASVPSGSSPVAVSASASGLASGTLYDYRLVASNSNGSNYGSDETFTTTGPGIDREWSSGVSSDGATVNAELDPEGVDTTYHFEYGTSPCSGGGCTSVPVPDADAGSGSSDVQVSEPLSGLQAGTTYYYRIVATQGSITADGSDDTFTTFAVTIGSAGSCPNAEYRTGASAALPDCRAWEQVSPVDKDGIDAIDRNAIGQAQATADGSGIQWMQYQGGTLGTPVAAPINTAYVATRSGSGWSTANVSPPTPDSPPPGAFTADYDFSADLTWNVVNIPGEAVTAGAAPNVENLFLRHPDGSYSLVTSAAPAVGCPAADPSEGTDCYRYVDQVAFAGASSDYSELIFQDNGQLTPDAPSGVSSLYENSGGTVSLVGILPDGSVASHGSGAGSDTGIGLVDIENAISADGSRVFFTARADGGAPDPAQKNLPEIYERVDGSSTVEISAPASGSSPVSSAAGSAEYWGATPDGSEVLFTSKAELTTNANTGGGSGNDLYEYDTSTGALTDLSVDTNSVDAATGADVQGVVGMSDDGSYVYFVADGQLVSGKGTDGQPNLYLSHDGTVTFIATLSANNSSDWTNTTSEQQAYVTPDGENVALMSVASLTGYDNTDQNTGTLDEEVYEYSAQSNQLTCVSCDRTGAEPVGDSYLGSNDSSGALSSTSLYQPRVVSDDGTRVFFTSPDALTPGAGSQYEKVYEFEQDGAGSCQTAGGCVYLLGAAQSANDVFLDASASGDDVFIASADQLAPTDDDQLMDVYDGRVDGGLPAPAASSQCTGDSCQGEPTAAPTLPTAGTVDFSGPGNTSTKSVGRVRLLRKAVSGDRFRLTVRVPARGRVTITGKDVKRVSHEFKRAGSVGLTVVLTTKARRLLSSRKRLLVAIKVRYQPASGSASSVSSSVTLTREHASKRKRTEAKRNTPPQAAALSTERAIRRPR